MTKESTTSHLFLLAAVVTVFIWSAIKPAGYLIWALEVVPAIVGLIIVIAAYNKFRLTTLSYVILTILTIAMLVGGHYTYSKVPLFNWIKDVYDLNRNHYDRLGHLLKGLLTIVIREVLLRKTLLTKGFWLFIILISMSLAIAALYEIIEWLVSNLSRGEKAAADFLGTQGDPWDTQWDMLCILIGSLIALFTLTKLHDKLLNKQGRKS